MHRKKNPCVTYLERGHSVSSLPGLTARLHTIHRGRTLNCTEFPLFTWTHQEAYNGGLGPESERPTGPETQCACTSCHGVSTMRQGKAPSGGHGEHAGDTDPCQPDATPGTHDLVLPVS